MANNLSTRITALERLRGASTPPLFVCTHDDVPLTTAELLTISEAEESGQRVIIIHNAPPD